MLHYPYTLYQALGYALLLLNTESFQMSCNHKLRLSITPKTFLDHHTFLDPFFRTFCVRTDQSSSSSVPPKYLVTTATTLCSSCPVSTSSIGFPAVPLGSPSSLQRKAGCFLRYCMPSSYALHPSIVFNATL